MRIIQMGVEPVQIHVMSEISSVTWNEAWAGRLKDLADIEAIEGQQSD